MRLFPSDRIAMAVKAPMPKVEVKAPEIKPQVAKEAVEDLDSVEEVEVEQDEYWR